MSRPPSLPPRPCAPSQAPSDGGTAILPGGSPGWGGLDLRTSRPTLPARDKRVRPRPSRPHVLSALPFGGGGGKAPPSLGRGQGGWVLTRQARGPSGAAPLIRSSPQAIHGPLRAVRGLRPHARQCRAVVGCACDLQALHEGPSRRSKGLEGERNPCGVT